MKNFIKVYDNILPLELSDAIEDLIFGGHNRIPLFYNPNIATNNRSIFAPAFSSMFYESSKNLLSPNSHLFLEVLYRLGQFTNIAIQHIVQGRVFVHLPSPNPGPDEKHVDLLENHWVCLYYINDSEGDTIIFKDNGEERQRITPKKGRIVFFDGTLKHCSSRPATKTRAVLNFDFQGHPFGSK
jgi:hypothetical protein